jgi:predicted DNA-binding transcriptional regulator AlpA
MQTSTVQTEPRNRAERRARAAAEQTGQQTIQRPESFWTEAAVSQVTTLSRATINRKVAKGEFPRPIYISERRKAWKASTIQQWMAERTLA